jgi:hypothetical protein
MNAQFVDDAALFVRPTLGAMAEASLAGQQITYLPKDRRVLSKPESDMHLTIVPLLLY